jgi:hypothetical protein
VSPDSVAVLLGQLSERDQAILSSLRSFRLLTTAHIRRLHFALGHATPGAAATAVMRVLTRLERHNLVARLQRRIGGVRAGSSGITWHLGAAGERLQRVIHGDAHRRRYVEPKASFVDHTLAVAELAIQLHELANAETSELVRIETEPGCWRKFVGKHGTVEWLKPDLFAITASGDFEDHWFLEADRSTEHPPDIVKKARVYQQYWATGAHQAKHGLFPAVVWVVPDTPRADAIARALAADTTLKHGLLRITTAAEFQGLITRGHPEHQIPDTNGKEESHRTLPTYPR